MATHIVKPPLTMQRDVAVAPGAGHADTAGQGVPAPGPTFGQPVLLAGVHIPGGARAKAALCLQQAMCYNEVAQSGCRAGPAARGGNNAQQTT
jgi:hypothetical protein